MDIKVSLEKKAKIIEDNALFKELEENVAFDVFRKSRVPRTLMELLNRKEKTLKELLYDGID